MLIPISRRDNFNDKISLEVTIKLDDDDRRKINEFAANNTNFRKIKSTQFIKYYRHYHFKDSKFAKLESLWTLLSGCLKSQPKEEYVQINNSTYGEDNFKLADFCSGLIPSIFYFPNFLFDFPSKIYLIFKNESTSKEKFYLDLIQDVLFSLENGANIKTHLVSRIQSKDDNDKRNLISLLQKMSRKVTDTVFEAWNRIFKREIRDTRIVINYDIDVDNLPYLDFSIEAQDRIYQINERSLGFRWFFVFLLFTQFRPYRKDTPQNLIFLFDEPASNLHSSAQKQLLKSFENLTKNSKVIYTTHSHHLINPNWLESTYVVKNEGLKLESPEKYITIQSYREFVIIHPHNTAYFQPVLDVLDYTPSNLESLPNCVFVEGKNDYYTIAYFQEVVFSKDIKINIAPSTGSGNIDSLISLYIGWGKEFIVLLDSDKEGEKQKKRYIDNFGAILESRVFTLEDIDAGWKKSKMENLMEDDALGFQKLVYKDSASINKTHLNRAIQECLINRVSFKFSLTTMQNFDKVINFLNQRISSFK